jgi:hypothetical protein
MTGKSVLIRARSLIEHGTWVQHGGGTGIGQFCILTALDMAAGKGLNQAWLSAYEAMGKAVKYPDDIANWNDVKGRTKQQVLEAFDRAIMIIGGGFNG